MGVPRACSTQEMLTSLGDPMQEHEAVQQLQSLAGAGLLPM